MTDWEKLATENKIDQIAQALIDCSTDFDFDKLRTDPIGTLQDRDDIQLIFDRSFSETDCRGGGYYRQNPPQIYLHPTMWRRDNFTVLHELGHHLQVKHQEWCFSLLDMPRERQRTVEEQVSHAIAARILIPFDDSDRDWEKTNVAEIMANLYAESEASRSAVLLRVKSLMPANSRWILAVSDLGGEVVSSSTTYHDLPPATKSVQSSFAELALQARGGPTITFLSEAIEYRNRSVLGDMRATAALDSEGRYVFVALTPTHRFATGSLGFRSLECANPVCGESFDLRSDTDQCAKCGVAICPACKTCECALRPNAPVCGNCYMVLSPAEVADNSHEC
ncbi:ImmA/IrrE family metallo-endopeptidase [Dietzia sp. E1]|nr:ImmA/IrrE family metallo-endopeptidase [Dietzia sp. E1]